MSSSDQGFSTVDKSWSAILTPIIFALTSLLTSLPVLVFGQLGHYPHLLRASKSSYRFFDSCDDLVCQVAVRIVTVLYNICTTIASPFNSSGLPTAIASATAGWDAAGASTSAAPIL